MDDIKEFFADLFKTDLWPARWHCGYWSPFHGWMYIISDLMIWFAYFAIPAIILAYITRKKYELKYTRTYFLFASFILLCGSTHLIDAAMFWHPMYRFNAVVRLITGIVSMLTVYHLIKILPAAFQEKTSVVLQREIAKRAEAERKLADANEGLKSYAYMASHDLQEPVRKVNAYVSQLLESEREKLDAGSVRLLDKTIDATHRMSQIIQGILNLSSISNQAVFEQVKLDQIVEQAISDLEIKINETKATINIAALPVAVGNHGYLVQLFVNLISNAIKFSKERPLIEIGGSSNGDTSNIFIRDNGIGMKQEDTQRIFNAFERLHSRADFEGTGIGLAICKRIIEVHAGSITVESQLGRGTTFTITLPSR